MNLDLAYLGRSGLTTSGDAAQLSFAPNLCREPVAFDAALRQPLRFREAISALHDVVVCDLRVAKPDRTAWRAFRAAQQSREQHIRTDARTAAQKLSDADVGITPELRREFGKATKRYWKLRDQYSRLLQREDPDLWRMLTPCDPIVTVADDVCLFEGFSVDESAYGCLSVRRDDGFAPAAGVQLGTTNVDYSQALFEQFQQLRTYRQTRFLVDPKGFTVRTAGNPDYREEKIDLPAGWLRGLMQVQVAAGLPATTVRLPRELVYSLLAFLRRHRERSSPRALRFELVEGQPPAVVLEPFGERLVAHGCRYDGPSLEPIRIWGRRRLQVLARVLPLADTITVHLVGTGLPSFWVVGMGEMTLTLGLSGWTANDWTRGSSLDLLRPPTVPGRDAITIVAGLLQQRRCLSRRELFDLSRLPAGELLAALDHLARAGQVLFDLAAGVYRFRSILPQPLGEADIGGRNPELLAACASVERGEARVDRREALPMSRTFATGKVDKQECEVLFDADQRLLRGKCGCKHHRKNGLRNGPCQHLLALRMVATATTPSSAVSDPWQQLVARWLPR
ncbi:MAG: metal-binding protein [Planctomycetes bacterium]|nr:metal-binding protein [Planctomycetota bacterium]